MILEPMIYLTPVIKLSLFDNIDMSKVAHVLRAPLPSCPPPPVLAPFQVRMVDVLFPEAMHKTWGKSQHFAFL